MRPIKLMISAFGPYGKEQEVDFNKLNGENIFLITGPTGAGKTTIFDAISFALFGSASGESRENDSLRSDFAKDDIETYVELDFEFRDEIYKLRRAPQQLKKKKRGEGFTVQSAEAQLTLPEGKIITRYSAVTEKVEEILGINKEQFKQIVMLPQGEFKKLLLAESKDRETIFRKIFETYDYQIMQSKLKDRAVALKNEVDKIKTEARSNIKGINGSEELGNLENIDYSSILEKIKLIIEGNKKLKKEKEEVLKALVDKKENINKQLIQAEANNKVIKEKVDTEEKIKAHIDKKDIVEIQSKKIENGKKALEITPIENIYIENLRQFESKTKEQNSLKLILKDKEELYAKASNKLKLENDKEPERDKLKNEILLIKDKEGKLSKKEELEKTISISEKQYKEIEARLTELVAKDKKGKARLEEVDLLLKEIDKREKELIDLRVNCENKDKARKALGTLYNIIKEYYLINKVYQEEKALNPLREANYLEVKKKYEELELNFKKGQAGILASNLNEGMACPVCGSVEHPKLAELSLNVPSEKELEVQKEIFEKSKNEYDIYLNNLKVKLVELESKERDSVVPKLTEINESLLLELELNNDTNNKIMEIGKAVGKEVTLLSNELEKGKEIVAKRPAFEKEVLEINKILKDIASEKETLDSKKIIVYGELETSKNALKSINEEIPSGIKSLSELKQLISNKEKQLNEMIATFEEVKKLEALLAKEVANVSGSFEAVAKLVIELEKSSLEAKNNFDEAIKKSLFKDKEDYINNKITSMEITKLEEYIRSYNEELRSLRDKLEDLNEKTKELSVIDLSNLSEELSKIIIEEKEANEELQKAYSRLENNKARYKQSKELIDRLNTVEESYKVIGELANVANGKVSPYITFESYVLASYFQEIIDSANLRLGKMTGDRFLLKRKEDKGKGAGQKGLELEVFDNYTGKLRHVKTLSGGESFKASLALALGLSDIIQSSAGGIKLDTMFIDEGFGTLDPESLDNAVGCLLELQRSGRLVGVISHVPELKERIGKRLEINSSKDGSSCTFN